MGRRPMAKRKHPTADDKLIEQAKWVALSIVSYIEACEERLIHGGLKDSNREVLRRIVDGIPLAR